MPWQAPSGTRGNTSLTSLSLVSVRRHGNVDSVKVEIKFRLECTVHVPTNASNYCSLSVSIVYDVRRV